LVASATTTAVGLGASVAVAAGAGVSVGARVAVAGGTVGGAAVSVGAIGAVVGASATAVGAGAGVGVGAGAPLQAARSVIPNSKAPRIAAVRAHVRGVMVIGFLQISQKPGPLAARPGF
jgi:hypothetical protein